MTFEETLQQTIVILQSRGRVSYRALKRQFNLDDDYLDDLTAELLYAYPQVVDDDGRGLVWSGERAAASTASAAPSPVTGYEFIREPRAYTPPHLVEKILTSHAALQGERKQVTVLFCDLANNTGLAEQLGPETMHTVLHQFFELALGAIHRYEGTINQFLGDGFMALFGAPIAHEDHARRAVLAALEFRRKLHAYNSSQDQPQGVELTVRIGLNTGMVVVGAIGDNLRMDYTAVGDTTNVAARLEQEAAPNQIVLSESTHRLVAGYCTTRPLGTFALKGKTIPVAAWEVLTAREARTRLEVEAERGLTPLVGRARELQILHDCFAQACTGHGQVVFLVGEAGIGKSRLLLEFRHQLGEAEATWLEGHALSFGQAMAFHPLLDLLKRNFRIEEDAPEGLIIEKIERSVLRLGGELQPILPYLRYFLAVDPGDAAVRTMDPQLRRAELFAALRRLLVRATEVRPQVLVFEDLHWMDKATEAALLAIADSIPSSRVLCLFTYRPGYVHPFGDRTYHTRLALPPLSTQDSMQMAQAILATEQLPAALQTLIMQKAEGNPFFVEEVVKSLQEMGAIRRIGTQYVLTKPIEEIVVPDTIQDVLMARIDRLEEAPKQTLQLAAVIGRAFTYRLLRHLGDIQERTEASLQALKAIELIYETSLYPEVAYMFKHALTQDVAYNSLLVQRRQELHRTVGYAIEELYADRLAEHYAELAHHFAQGEVWEKAMEYSTLAGDRAAAAYANAEAKAHYVRALEAAAQITPSPGPGVMAPLHAKHGAVLMVLGEYEEAVAAYQRALELIRQTEDRRGEIDILVGLSEVYRRDHREEPAVVVIEQALALACELGDRAFEALCLANRVSIHASGYGQLVDATPDAEEALRLAREIGDPKLLAETLICLGRVLQWRAVFDQSLAYLHEGVELAQRVHAGHLIGSATSSLGSANAAKGKYEEALQWYRQLSGYASAAADTFWLARVSNYRGGIHLELFDLSEALRLYLEGDEVAQRLYPWPEPRGHSLVNAGLVHLLQDEHGRAEAYFRRAEALLEVDTWMCWRWHMALLRAFGELALAQGRHDEAWTYATQSLELAIQTDSQKHVARAQWLQGEILIACGRLEEAAQILTASIRVAAQIQTLREVWLGQAALGKVLARLGRDKEAETQFTQAAQVIEAIAAHLQTPRLCQSFLSAAPVLEVYAALGHRPPPATP